METGLTPVDEITISEFIAEHELTMTAERVPENPNMKPAPGDKDGARWSQEATHFFCTIENPTRETELTIYFSVGIGNVESWARNKAPSHIRMRLRNSNPRLGRYSLDAHQAINDARDYYKPDLESVLDCLASDAASVDCENRFEDWAMSLGYDPDSRRAESIYNICRDQAGELESLLGYTDYQRLLYNTERL